MNRNDTLFSIRYAARVLERHTRFWRRIDALVRIASVLSGSASFAALTAGNPAWALPLGVLFAACQALEFGIRPADQAAKSMASRTGYARLLANAGDLGDADLEAAYWRLSAEDDVVVPEPLRLLAYNDVLAERGCDPSHAYAMTGWLRLVAFFA